jgi:hypothetical protein
MINLRDVTRKNQPAILKRPRSGLETSAGRKRQKVDLCANDGDGFEHANPARETLLMRSDDLERAFFFGQRGAIQCVRNDDVVFKNARIEFPQKRDDAITVCRFGDDVSGHGCAVKMFAIGDAGSRAEFLRVERLGIFPSFGNADCDGKGFARKLFQIPNGEGKKAGRLPQKMQGA